MLPVRHPRTLLLTLDAFNTIFHPRQPVPEIYTHVAQDLGVIPSTITADAVKPAFRTAFKRNSAQYPNYGRDTPGFGGPKAWWGKVIRECFAQVKGGSTTVDEIPDRLVETLFTVFGEEAYKLYNDAEPFFRKLQLWKQAKRSRNVSQDLVREDCWDRIVVGVISNSDDRVPTILRSMGLRVGSAWADNGDLLPPADETHDAIKQENDIDFIVTSYEAGKEKPNKHIFDVAQKRAGEYLNATSPAKRPLFPAPSYYCIHVGDDYHDDYQGGQSAGWDSFLLLREDVEIPEHAQKSARSISNLDQLFSLLRMEDHDGRLV
ncbi:hypothetical protein DIZ76_015950 [Coccidioides immitis]|nr:hypothetical protein DIZ76_015950 [Coccidioides immitis]